MLVSNGGSSLYRSLRDAQIPISTRNELKAMQNLLDMVNSYLAQYPTSLEADIARLQGNELAPFSNERHALIQIKGEKEVLIFLHDFATTSIALLHTTDIRQFEDLVEEVRSVKHPVIYYHAKGPLARLLQDEHRRIEIRRRKMDLTRPTVV